MSDFPSAPPPPPPPPPQGPASGPPPGYVAYGTPAAQGWTKPIRGLGKALLILQSIGVLASIGVFIVNLSLVDTAKDFLDGDASLSTFEDDLAPYYTVALLAGALGLATIVVLIVWSFRIAKNLQARNHNVTWKPGLTIVVWLLGGCTLSIINFLMLREHWAKSDPDRMTVSGGTTAKPSTAIVVWFVLSLAQVGTGLAAGIRSVGGFSFGNDSESIAETLSDQFAWSMASAALAIATAIALIFVVRQMTERHARFTGEA